MKRLQQVYGVIPEERIRLIWVDLDHAEENIFRRAISEYIADNKYAPTRKEIREHYQNAARLLNYEVKTDKDCERCGGTGVMSVRLDNYEYAFCCSNCYTAANKKLNYAQDYQIEEFAKLNNFKKIQILYTMGEFTCDPKNYLINLKKRFEQKKNQSGIYDPNA